MTEEIQYTLELTIKPGGLDPFKELVNKITNMVRDNEPDIKGYQWYFNDDETKCYIAEWHTNSESLLAHLQNVGEVLPELLGHCDITRFEVFGNPNAQPLEAVSGLGAEVFGYFIGFTR